ncbi:hypothetical protein HAX54_006608 [Datura stramonium]|uniref:Uncharacterized protein n=1 Tax=Datura stramonium TaxID=4076 RepID=A0ABS8TBY3_DATST|nr:hypothetical protein [Datura stramonium]
MVWSLLTVDYVQERKNPLTATSINEALGTPNPPEDGEAQDMEENGYWLVDTLVMEEHRASSHWGVTWTGIHGVQGDLKHFSPGTGTPQEQRGGDYLILHLWRGLGGSIDLGDKR